MGLWDAASEWDWEAATRPSSHTVERTCAECGVAFPISRREPYAIAVACPRCVDARAEQPAMLKADLDRKAGAA